MNILFNVYSSLQNTINTKISGGTGRFIRQIFKVSFFLNETLYEKVSFYSHFRTSFPFRLRHRVRIFYTFIVTAIASVLFLTLNLTAGKF